MLFILFLLGGDPLQKAYDSVISNHIRMKFGLIVLRSQIFLRYVRVDLDLIMNAERFTRIDQIFDYECNDCYFICAGEEALNEYLQTKTVTVEY